jgi:hypothetical protein
MFLWYPVLDLARAPRRTARKKGSGYENEVAHAGLGAGAAYHVIFLRRLRSYKEQGNRFVIVLALVINFNKLTSPRQFQY